MTKEGEKPFDPDATDEFPQFQSETEESEGALNILQKGRIQQDLLLANERLHELKTARRLLQKERRSSYVRSEQEIETDLDNLDKEIEKALEERQKIEGEIKRKMVDSGKNKKEDE